MKAKRGVQCCGCGCYLGPRYEGMGAVMCRRCYNEYRVLKMGETLRKTTAIAGAKRRELREV